MAKAVTNEELTDKMDELAQKAPEVEISNLNFAVTTPDGDDVEVTFTYPKDRGMAVLRTISQMNEFGPGAAKALIELKDPSIMEAYERQSATETKD